MKKIALLILVFFSTICLSAQNVTTSIAFLENGSSIKCNIVELTKENVKLQTSDGSIFVFDFNDVTKIIQDTSLVKKEINEIKEQELSKIALAGGRMSYLNQSLALDGKILSNEEVLNLVGNDIYSNTYVGAIRQERLLKPLVISGGVVATVSLGLMIAGFVILQNGEWGYSGYYLVPGCILFAAGNGALATGITFHTIGKSRLNWIADQYNSHQNKKVSLSIVPNITKFKTPTNNQYAFGASLQIHF